MELSYFEEVVTMRALISGLVIAGLGLGAVVAVAAAPKKKKADAGVAVADAGVKKAEVAAGSAFDPAAAVEELWVAKCKGCHGEHGGAETANAKKWKSPDMTDPAWQAKNDAEKVRAAIRDGVADTKMRAYGTKMTAEQLEAFVTTVKGFKR
jgi:hypothetical protein